MRRAQWGVGALVVAALAVGQFLHDRLPQPRADRPFVVQEGSDGLHHLREGTVEIERIEGSSRVLLNPSDDVPLTTTGLFVVVHFAWTPTTALREFVPAPNSGVFTDGDGQSVVFSHSGSRSQVICSAEVLKIPSACFAVIEVDPRTVPGGRLELGGNALDERWDSVAGVDLAVTRADVEAWRNAPTIELPRSGQPQESS